MDIFTMFSGVQGVISLILAIATIIPCSWAIRQCAIWFECKRLSYGWIALDWVLMFAVYVASSFTIAFLAQTHLSVALTFLLASLLYFVIRLLLTKIIFGTKGLCHTIKFYFSSILAIVAAGAAFTYAWFTVLFFSMLVLTSVGVTSSMPHLAQSFSSLTQHHMSIQSQKIESIPAVQKPAVVGPDVFIAKITNQLCACPLGDKACVKEYLARLLANTEHMKKLAKDRPDIFTNAVNQRIFAENMKAKVCVDKQRQKMQVDSKAAAPIANKPKPIAAKPH